MDAFDRMTRVRLIAWLFLFISPTAFSQSDEEILEKVRANAANIYLQQASFTLPKSFHDSGLAPSDKKRLIDKWANASATCLADALAEYAKTTDTPLSEMVNDDWSFSLKGDGSSSDFYLNLETCIERVWQTVGASLP